LEVKDDHLWSPLPRQEVIKAVERKRPSRVPLVRAKWWGEGLYEQYGERLQAFDRFPEDAVLLLVEPLDAGAMGLSWDVASEGAHDARCIVDDWGKLDEFIQKLPDPETDAQFGPLVDGPSGAWRTC
jgi:hypothetical protein